MGINVIVVVIVVEVCDKYVEYCCYVSFEVGLVYFVSFSGIDLLCYGFDELICYEKNNVIELVVKNFIVVCIDFIVCKFFDQLVLGGCYVILVGDLCQVVDDFEGWIVDIGLDGFNLICIVELESYVDFIDLVVFELQVCGSYKIVYVFGILWEKFFGGGCVCLQVEYVGVVFCQFLVVCQCQV